MRLSAWLAVAVGGIAWMVPAATAEAQAKPKSPTVTNRGTDRATTSSRRSTRAGTPASRRGSPRQTTPPAAGTTQPAPPPPVLFTADERRDLVRMWRERIDWTRSVPESAREAGLYSVRLTVPGSTWFWTYNRNRGLRPPPTVVPGAQTPEQEVWEKWIDARVALDRWLAQQFADEANRRLLGRTFPPVDDTIPRAQPPDPGPVPDGLVALAGNPPRFAEAVAPVQHTVRFPDGHELRYVDNIRMRPRFAFYRFANGVQSLGATVRTLPADRLRRLFRSAGVTDREANVMRAVSLLEGGFDSVNTYDTGWVSVGFIQFATLSSGGNSLGAMLRDYRRQDRGNHQRDFRQYGIDATDEGILCVIDPETGAQLIGQDAARKVIEDPRLIAVFQRAGQRSEEWNAHQIRSAKAQFFPDDETFAVNLADGRQFTVKVSDVVRSEAGLATLMDRFINRGTMDPLASVLSAVANEFKADTAEELLRLERVVVERMKYRKDYLADTSLQQPPKVDRRR